MSENVIPMRRTEPRLSHEELAAMQELAVVALAAEFARLRKIEAAARADMAKVAEHERCHYEHIRVSAFAELRAALEG